MTKYLLNVIGKLLIKVHLLPQLHDPDFVSILLKRHALLVGSKKKRKKDKSKKKEK